MSGGWNTNSDSFNSKWNSSAPSSSAPPPHQSSNWTPQPPNPPQPPVRAPISPGSPTSVSHFAQSSGGGVNRGGGADYGRHDRERDQPPHQQQGGYGSGGGGGSGWQNGGGGRGGGGTNDSRSGQGQGGYGASPQGQQSSGSWPQTGGGGGGSRSDFSSGPPPPQQQQQEPGGSADGWNANNSNNGSSYGPPPAVLFDSRPRPPPQQYQPNSNGGDNNNSGGGGGGVGGGGWNTGTGVSGASGQGGWGDHAVASSSSSPRHGYRNPRDRIAPTGHGGTYGGSRGSSSNQRSGDSGGGNGGGGGGGYGGTGGGGRDGGGGGYGGREGGGGGGYGAREGGGGGGYSGSGGGRGGGYGAREGGFSAYGNREPFNFDQIKGIDFDKVTLAHFNKDFYRESKTVTERLQEDVDAFRAAKRITVFGEVPKPIQSWKELSIPQQSRQFIEEKGYTEPTAIQAQAFPMALSGKDVVAISETGSGKTLAFGLPAMLHIGAQPPTNAQEGPIVLVLSPTRELAVQTLEVFNKLGASFDNIRSACVYGGIGKRQQLAEIQSGVDALIATPGRLLDFIANGDVSLNRVTYFVIDEADRMLYQGFGEEVKRISSMIRPERQMLMFSATWPHEVHSLAEVYLKGAGRVHIGAEEAHAASKIKQEVRFPRGYRDKRDQLAEIIEEVKQVNGKLLIFINTKRSCQELCDQLRAPPYGHSVVSLHGDKLQEERNFVLNEFRLGTSPILCATDVAERGLDIDAITVVLNFDTPQNIEDYVHRIGRTGRAGKEGRAITFLNDRQDAAIAGAIMDVMNRAQQVIPEELINLAGESTGSSFGSSSNSGGYGAPPSSASAPNYGPPPSRTAPPPPSYGAPPASTPPAATASSSSAADAEWENAAGGWGASSSAATAPRATTPPAGDWSTPSASSSSLKPKLDESDRVSISSGDTARATGTRVAAASLPLAGGWGNSPSSAAPSSALADSVGANPPSPIELRSRSLDKNDAEKSDGYDSNNAPSSSPEIGASPSPSPATSVEDLQAGEGEKNGMHEPVSSPALSKRASVEEEPAVKEEKDAAAKEQEDDAAWFDKFVAEHPGGDLGEVKGRGGEGVA